MKTDAVITQAFSLLSTDATLLALLGGEKVFTSVDEDTATPFVRLLASEVPWAITTNGTDESCLVTLVVEIWSLYEGTAELEDIGKRVQALVSPMSAWSGVSGFGGVLRGPIEAPITEFLIGQELRRSRVLTQIFFS